MQIAQSRENRHRSWKNARLKILFFIGLCQCYWALKFIFANITILSIYFFYYLTYSSSLYLKKCFIEYPKRHIWHFFVPKILGEEGSLILFWKILQDLFFLFDNRIPKTLITPRHRRVIKCFYESENQTGTTAGKQSKFHTIMGVDFSFFFLAKILHNALSLLLLDRFLSSVIGLYFNLLLEEHVQLSLKLR